MLNKLSCKQTSYKGKYEYGKYLIASDSGCTDFLTKWISSCDFTAYEKKQFRLDGAQGRPRNILYSLNLPSMHQATVMKVSHISPRYRLSRKIDLFITSLYKDYCKISFHGAKALCDQNLPVAKPLAFWTLKQGFFSKKSYCLHSKLPDGQSVKQLLMSPQINDFNCDFHVMAEKLVFIIKGIHDAGLRHGDLHTGNIHTHAPKSTSTQIKNLSELNFFMVDYDNCSIAKIKIPWVKKIFDLKDLSSLVIPTVRDDDLLEMYFRSTPSPSSIRIFKFWKKGGVNLRQKLGLPPKREDRHLAR